MKAARGGPGKFVHDCPSCPRVGVNLTPDWLNLPNKYVQTHPAMRVASTFRTNSVQKLKYTTAFGGDGNMHLQLREHKTSLINDPSFWGDDGFWANQQKFDAYVSNALKLDKRKLKVSRCQS